MSGAYESITAYDVPQVLAGQALQGRLTPSNIRRTLLDPGALSPRDRQDVAGVIANKTGMGGVPEGIIDFATNPYILLLALTRSPGLASIRREGSLQAVREGKSSYSTVYRPWLHKWIMGVAEATKGTEMHTVVSRFAQRMETYGNYVHAEMAHAEAGMVKRINQLIEQRTGKAGRLKALDFKGLRRNSPEYKELRRFNRVLAARATHSDRTFQQDVLQGTPRFLVRVQGADGSWGKWRKWDGHKIGGTEPAPGELVGQLDQLQRGRILSMQEGGRAYQMRHEQPTIKATRTEAKQKLHKGLLDQAWREYGIEGDDFVRTAADARRWTRWKMLGDESHLRTWQDEDGWHMSVRNEDGEVLPFAFDERKLWRFAKRIAHENKHLGDDAKTLRDMESRELLEGIIEPDRIDEFLKAYGPSGPLHARNKKWWLEKAKPQLEEVLSPQDWADDLWMPRTVLDVVGFYDGAGRKIVPGLHHTQLKSQADATREGSGDAIAGGVVGRLMPRRHAEIPMHWEDLEGLERDIPGILTDEGRAHIRRQWREARNKYRRPSPESPSRAIEAYRLDYLTSHRMYLDQMVQAAAQNSPIDMGIVAAESLHKKHWTRQGKTAPKTGTLREPGDSVDNAFHDHETRMSGMTDEASRQDYMEGFSLWDQIERSAARHDASWGDFLRTTVVPTAIHRQRTPAFLTYANSQLAKARAAWIADPLSAHGKILRATPWGNRFADHLQEVSQTPGIVHSTDWGRGVARYLYVTHLGANLSSVALNLTQPLLMAAAVGDTGVIARAYGKSFKEMSGYLKDRLAYGPASLIKGIPEAEKQRLIHQNFELTRLGGPGEELNTIGITPDFHRVVDEMTASQVRGKGVVPRIEELMMTLFEKSEWFNRSVAGHVANELHLKHGVPGDLSTRQSDIEWLVNFTQFGASPTNRPGFLREGFLSNALFRVFLTFPTRMATSAFSTFPAMEGNSLLNNTMRAMGISAVIHELSKNFLDVDISRGLFFDASTDIFGLERIVSGDDPIAARVAAINLPMSIIKGVSAGDQQELANAFSRLLPAGVAASRVLAVLPDARKTIMDPAGHLQKTYVDWGDPIVGQDGRTLYPMFTPEGRLIEYRSGPELVVRGLGVDLGTWGEQGSLDHYLVKQGQEMKGMRAEALRRLRIGDISGYNQIKNEFEDRFSDPKTGARVPFTVTQQQIRSAVDSTVRGRSERILNSLPSDYRSVYQQMVSSSGYARNLARETLLQEKTARARDPWRWQGTTDRDTRIRDLTERLERLEKPTGPFGSF